MRNTLWALALGAIFGAACAIMLRTPPAVYVDPALRDSLAVAVAQVDELQSAVARAAERSRADSVALANVQRVVRVVADTIDVSRGTLPETTTVYKVPAPVATLVRTLEARVVGLQIEVDSLTLANVAAANALALARQVEAQTAQALEAERQRRWRYRLEGAGVGGLLTALALIIIAL